VPVVADRQEGVRGGVPTRATPLADMVTVAAARRGSIVEVSSSAFRILLPFACCDLEMWVANCDQAGTESDLIYDSISTAGRNTPTPSSGEVMVR
jgi:hypothetical protein